MGITAEEILAEIGPVQEVLDAHEIPSEELIIVPPSPTETNTLFPYSIPCNWFVVPDDLDVQEELSEDVIIAP